MGNIITQYLQFVYEALVTYFTRPYRILLLGLDCAGKTTLLYMLKLGKAVLTDPTIVNVERFQYKNIQFKVWDIGGETKLRPLWKNYVTNTDAIIYVVDASNRSRADEAVRELHTVLKYEELKDAKLLVFANKQDRPYCMKMEELEAKLNLAVVTKNAYHIQKTVAFTGVGVYEGLDWLIKAIEGK